MNEQTEISHLMPEVRSNLVYALPAAKDPSEVMAYPGRLTFDGEKLVSTGRPVFGSSSHLSGQVIEVMNKYPDIRSAMNVRYDRKFIDTAETQGLVIASYDRRREPQVIKEKEGASTRWGVSEALSKIERRPDIVYHLGDWGKEPMIIVFGEDPLSVVKKITGILKSSRED
jgi:hydroxymethylpyrimidine/phosphomethylpyrimidine kinase